MNGLPVDGMHKRLASLGRNNPRGFYTDFISIGILIIMGVMSFADVMMNTLIGISFIDGFFAAADFYVFSNYHGFTDLKSKIKERGRAYTVVKIS